MIDLIEYINRRKNMQGGSGVGKKLGISIELGKRHEIIRIED